MENATINNQNLNATPNNIPKPQSIVEWVISYAAYPIAILLTILFVHAGLSICLSTFIAVFATLFVGSFAVTFIIRRRDKKNGTLKPATVRKWIKATIKSSVTYATISIIIALIVNGIAALI